MVVPKNFGFSIRPIHVFTKQFYQSNLLLVKFIYSEKATKFCEISTVDLSYVVPVKSTVEIAQNFVAFSDYMNLTLDCSLISVFLPIFTSFCMM